MSDQIAICRMANQMRFFLNHNHRGPGTSDRFPDTYIRNTHATSVRHEVAYTARRNRQREDVYE
eukprot:1717305-Pyramimonas_sp.AAC.1